MSKPIQETLMVATKGRGSYEITNQVRDLVAHTSASGLCHLFITHTSASLLITENADPDVRRDLESYMAGLVEDGDPRFVHDAEGPDDMAAHVRSVLTQTDLTLPISNGRLLLGTWQGIYVWEHRTQPHSRQVIVTIQA